MDVYSPRLFIEINLSELIFIVIDEDEKNDFQVIFKSKVLAEGFFKNEVFDFELLLKNLKENIFTLEKKINYTFKDVVLILNDFTISYLNFSGYRKLNGTQILRENIAYILNSSKSLINKIENKKAILHIFNSNFFLDKKKTENLPIGLFGDFYSHELSMCLIHNNDYKNLDNVFKKTNLKIKKIFLKSFIEGVVTSNKNTQISSFFQIQINRNNSKIFFFENGSLKFEQKFNFGYNILIKDISKVTSLKIETVKKIIREIKFEKNLSDEEILEKHFFKAENYRKIKKKLIYEIALSRMKELSEIMLTKNINFNYFKKNTKNIFLVPIDNSDLLSLEYIYKLAFTFENLESRIIENYKINNLIFNALKIDQYGWKKEAIPVVGAKKSLIHKFFDALFS